MPIDADGGIPGGKSERLPRQISRHLLPEREGCKSRELIEKAITNFFNNLGTSNISPFIRHSSAPQARPHLVEIRTPPTISKAQPVQRDNNSYTAVPIPESFNSEKTVKIERERYTAQPESGKVYNQGISLNGPPMLARGNSTSRTREAKESRHHSTEGAASQNYMPPRRAAGKRPNNPPPKSFSNLSSDNLGGYQYTPPSMTTSSRIKNQSQPFSPSYGSPGSIPLRFDRDRIVRDYRQNRRSAEKETTWLTDEFNSPLDARRWGRIQKSRSGESDRKDKPYRPTMSMDRRGVCHEDYYREGK
jgi:hypothetical protein